MKYCVCGCSQGLHFHTVHAASCARCGPRACPRFEARKPPTSKEVKRLIRGNRDPETLQANSERLARYKSATS